MKNRKIAQTILKASKRSAIRSTELTCRWFTYQPKTPAKLLDMKNSK